MGMPEGAERLSKSSCRKCGKALRGSPQSHRGKPYCAFCTRLYNLWIADQRRKIRLHENVNRYSA
jgi:hypothetical protein